MKYGLNKKIILSFWILLSGAISVIAQSSTDWIEISSNVPMSLPDGNFKDVHFVGNEGWITFDELYNNNGAILYTDNAGVSFSIQSIPEVPNVIEMVSTDIGFVGCLSGNVYYTSNGGEQWNLLSGSLESEIYGIDVIADPLMGYVCGKYGWISKFDTNQVYPHDQPFGNWMIQVDLHDIEFPLDTNEGWVCGELTIGHYADGKWDSLIVPPCDHYYALSFIDVDTGWCAGGQGTFMTPEIAHTKDGINWHVQEHPLLDQLLYDVYFLDKNWGWSVGYYILATIDGGGTWVKEAQNFGNIWNAVQAVYGSAVYVVGKNKRILKRDIIISVAELQSTRIMNAYPNPFATTTTIKYELTEPSLVQLTIYNAIGEVVYKAEDYIMPQGVHTVTWSPSHLPEGLYYAVLRSEEGVSVVKMVKQ